MRSHHLAILAAAFAAACASSDQPAGPDAGPPGVSTSALCTRDPALLATPRACVSDDQCPCGAHCTLGECTSECLDDTTCTGGQVCNDFGRCADPDDPSLSGLEPHNVREHLDVHSAHLRLVEGLPRRVTVVARSHLGFVRVIALGALEVSCDAGASFTTTCEAAASDLVTIEVLVRAATPFAEGEVRLFEVRTAGIRRSVTVTAEPPPAPPASERAGVYAGTATLVGLGAGELVRPDRSLAFPVRARYFASEGVLELEERLGVLHPEGRWAGRVAGAHVRFPRYLIELEPAVAGTTPALLVSADTATISFSGAGPAMAFALVMRAAGVLPDGGPAMHFQLALTREADLPAGPAPAVPADATLPASIDRALQRTDWESALIALHGAPSLARIDAERRGAADLGMCAGHDAAITAALSPHTSRLISQLTFHNGVDAAAWDAGQNVLFNTFYSIEGVRTDPRPIGNVMLNIAERLYAATGSVEVMTFGLTAASDPNAQYVGADGAVLPRVVPCAAGVSVMTAELFPQDPGGGLPFSGSQVCFAALQAAGGSVVAGIVPPYDVCAEVSAELDCDVVDVTAGPTVAYELVNARYVSFVPAGDSCSFSGSAYGTAPVQRVCRLRERPRSCAEGTLCKSDADPDAASSRLGETLAQPGGDLECASGGLGAGIERDRNIAGFSAAEMMKVCLADLDRLAAGPEPLATLPELLDATCIGPRLVIALGFASDRARRAAFGEAVGFDRAEATLAHRLLQRWLDVHTFLARESVHSERLASIIRRVDPADPDLPPPIELVMERSQRAWSLLLDPRFAVPLFAMRDDELAFPDYREPITGVPPPSSPNHDQSIGLPVAIAEAISAQLELADLRAERALSRPDARVRAAAGQALQRALFARAVAEALRRRAQTAADAAGTLLTWGARFDAELVRAGVRQQRLLERLDAIDRGVNPLGIEETDLPLYFFGDEASAGRRFSAISDYFLGSSLASATNWAPAAVAQAEGALGAARDAWNAFKQRQLERRIAAAELQQRLDEVAFEIGDKVASYCNAPDGLGTADLIEGWEAAHGRPFSASNCYLRNDRPECRVDLAAYAALLREEDVLFQFCRAAEVRRRSGIEPELGDPAYARFTQRFAECTAERVTHPVACPEDGVEACLRCDLGAERITVDLRRAAAQFSRAAGRRVPPAIVAEAENTCANTYATAARNLPSLDEIAGDTYDRATCYRGALGEQALTMRALARDVAIARAEMSELQESYDIAMASCMRLQLGNQALRAAQSAHDETMTRLRIGRAVADGVAAVAGGVKDCANTASTDITLGIASGIACGAAQVESVAQVASVALTAAMEQAQQAHESTMALIESQTEEQRCFIEAEMHLVGNRAAALRILRALDEMNIAVYQFGQMTLAADTYYADGLAALAAIRERTVIPPQHDFWLDEAVRTFQSRMEVAKRMTYLAVRAIEYEYQQSLTAAGAALAAEVPRELSDILAELLATSGTRSIGGRPSNLKAVLSFRDDVIQMADNSTRPAGELTLTPAQRFRLAVTDPRFAAYEAGTYVGQRIPFTLAPLAAIGLGDPRNVAVFSGADCAERLWSVSASLAGPSDVLVGSAPVVRLELEKVNTFYSRWCSAESREETYQVASVRPSRNLLRGGSVAPGALGLARETEASTRARMEAWVNVPPEQLHDDRYANGQTSELAARGLFGEYALFIPAASISRRQADGSRTDGIDLDRVEDVLLRLDYVSVARQ